VARKVEEHRIAGLNSLVVQKVAGEGRLDILLGRLAVQKHANLILRNLEVIREPSANAFGVVSTGFEVPNVAGLVHVYSNN
jgi:hypothetical protein